MSRSKDSPRILIGFGFLSLLLAASLLSCSDGNGTAFPSSVEVADVLENERTFVDSSRPTRANGNAPALGERSLATRVWYAPTPLETPACRGTRCALVVLAHGFGGRTSRFDAIARLLASAGYIVAAPAFPLTNQDTPGRHLSGFDDVVQQPKDLSVVIDGLLAAAEDRNDPLYRRIDGERIGAVGHSLGGTTVVAATHSQCCADTRIDAAALVAPGAVLVEPFFGAPPSPDGPPLLIINGRNDPLVRPASSLEFARSLTPPWYFLEILDVGHVLLIENIGDPQLPLYVTERATRAFFDEYLGGMRGATAAALEEIEAEGQVVEISE
jgi:dienelactone hydrolase